MADPVTALAGVGAASAIIQVVDFASKVALAAYQLARSTRNTLQQNAEIEALSKEYNAIAARVSSPRPQPLAQDDQLVEQLAERCALEARDLLQILEGLRLAEGSRGMKRVWHSVSKAGKAMWEKADIDARQQRLHNLNGRLAVSLLQLLRSSEAARFEDLLDFINSQGQNVATAVLESKQQILQRLEDVDFMEKARAITRSLQFPQMRLRRDTIAPAAYDTYEWVFSEASSLYSWLQSDHGVFWISGKAGSGKSTLVKFLSSHQRTEDLLGSWRNSKDLIVVDFYFWFAGTPMQKSVEGLLRSILYQIMSSCPDAAKIACPERWEEDSLATSRFAPRQWTETELEQSLGKIADVDRLNKGICFFIDGLDEFYGDHQRLINILRKLGQHSHIKICVSSRPWNVFTSAFEESVPNLRLEDLTGKDIERYVYGELDELPRSAEFQYLVSAIVGRAQGIFLWCFLVVRSIRSGFVEGDDIFIMQQRLDSFPSDLERYFDVILSRVDSVYQRRTAEYLQLAMLCHDLQLGNVPQFLLWWLITRATGSPEFAVKFQLRKVSAVQISEMAKETQKSLRAACKDLLYVSSTVEGCWDSQVLFLHRSVFEYLQSDHLQQLLSKNTPAGFADPVFLTRLHVVWLKLVPSQMHLIDQYLPIARRTIKDMVHHGAEAELMEDMALTMLHYIRRPISESRSHHFCGTENISGNCDFHETLYWTITSCPHIIHGADHHPWPLLYSVLGLTEDHEFDLLQTDILAVAMLLEAGADPNQYLPSQNDTVWHLFLFKWVAEVQADQSEQLLHTSRRKHVWSLASRLIEHGADLESPVVVRSIEHKCQSADQSTSTSRSWPITSTCSARDVLNFCVLDGDTDQSRILQIPLVIRR